jgi:hypothetical protein
MRSQVSGHRTQVLGLLLLVAVIGCKSKESSTTASLDARPEKVATSEGPMLLASIERTSCFGNCPIYKATFFDNGEVTYIGRNFVERVGTYTTLISAEDLEGILQMAKDVHYFELEDAYPTPVPDFPKCRTSVNIDGKTKNVLNGENAPRDLIGFERHLDGLLKDREWTKVSDNTRY